MPLATPIAEASISAALSAPRVSTYLVAEHGDAQRALELYGWNSMVSAALMVPAHFAEVITRNLVDEALASVYGPDWPWSDSFLRSLPQPKGAFNPHRHLRQTRESLPTTGKVIAELKFVFWQTMFTSRHARRVWDPYLISLLPGAPAGVTVGVLRKRIYDDLEAIRQVRNRVAHHEPIFTRDIAADLSRMLDLVQLRSPETATWVRSLEDVSTLLSARPTP